MSAAGRFTQFGKLPTEVRFMVWEYHFQTPQIHTIRNFQGTVPEPEDAMFLYENTTTYKASIADAEADQVARLVEKRRTRVALGKDITLNELQILGTMLETGEYPEYRGFAATVFPASVNWDTDLIYFDLPNVSVSPLSLAQDHPWTGRIQKMAIRLSRTGSFRHWRFQIRLEKTLACFVAMTELVLVIEPPRGSEGNWRQKPRDAYGFIPFDPDRDYKVLSGDHEGTRQLIEIYRYVFPRRGRKAAVRTAIVVDEA